ncbi:hypothetical protein ES702_03931 [subsurface metagenome]
MAKLNMANLFTVFLLMVIGLALTPTVVEQVGYVTGTGGDNLTGALLEISSFISFFGFFSITLSVSVGTAYSVILDYHHLINRRCINLYTIQRYKLRHYLNNFYESIGSSRSIFPPFFRGITII